MLSKLSMQFQKKGS